MTIPTAMTPARRPLPGRRQPEARVARTRAMSRRTPTMLLTEDQIAAAAGLPGPVVAELLLPGVDTHGLARAKSAVYIEEDAMKAQIAQQMLLYGIRFRYVQLAISTMPDDARELAKARDFWAQRVPAPSWRSVLQDKGWVAALILGALLIGVITGMSMAGLRA